MRIAVIQLAYGDEESFEERVERAAGLVAAQAGPDLVVPPALWGRTGFSYSPWAGAAPTPNGRWRRATAAAARPWGEAPTAR